MKVESAKSARVRESGKPLYSQHLCNQVNAQIRLKSGDRGRYSIFDIRYSIFDIRYSIFDRCGLASKMLNS
jgi:hypothetical protein